MKYYAWCHLFDTSHTHITLAPNVAPILDFDLDCATKAIYRNETMDVVVNTLYLQDYSEEVKSFRKLAGLE